MAEKGAGGDAPQQEEEGASGRAPGRNGQSSGSGVSTEQIMQTGNILLRGFITDRVHRSPAVDTTDVPELGAMEQQQVNPSTKKLCECLRKIGDELDGNMELQSPEHKFFSEVIHLTAVGFLQALCSRVPQMIRTIIDWTMEYLRDHVVQWIRDQGGWEGLLSYFGTPTWQTVGVFLAGVLTATVAIWRYS
ncbi:hypothetical protein GDO78_010629 [Eleutherodactylus coqui]|uniref:Bcl-2 Bcl-2 homology region 1-3 domain-containing protein n=1 Tax=Eleutherodactylus coqui TaxID=57060 RepID=A0A8J6F4I7_ELECQ|nr:hypothetical protein GDO78_010629 [Eleutherodactylus coqui]